MQPIDYETAAAIVAIIGVICVALGAIKLYGNRQYRRGDCLGYERGVEQGSRVDRPQPYHHCNPWTR